MNGISLSELCKCSGIQICVPCKMLVVAFIAIVSGIAGFLIGRRKK